MMKIKYLLISMLMSSFMYAGSCPLNQNLIKGGSFESTSDLNEWKKVSGDATPKIHSYISSSRWAGNPPANAGDKFLYAIGRNVTLEQTIDLSSCDNGTGYSFGVYLGGWGDGDSVKVQVIQQNTNNETLSEYDTQYYTSTRKMKYFSKNGSLLQGATKAIIKISIKRNRGYHADGYADLLHFTLNDDKFDERINGGFNLINPPNTRVVRGGVANAGNTVTCITAKDTISSNSELDNLACIDDEHYTSNMRFVRYIDIDNDSRTWNSSSSYFNLPNSYEQKEDGSGIAWAGLFWSGLAGYSKAHIIRHAYKDGNSYSYKYTGVGTNVNKNNIDFENTGVDNVLVKINNKNYINVDASKIYYVKYGGAVQYSAYSDITEIIKAAKLKKGKNTFQIANIFASEGREPGSGVSGGWTLVVIYNEDITAKVKSISTFFGLNGLGGKIKISGLRLPKYGDVYSKAIMFSSDGEFPYGRTVDHPERYDWIKISNQENSGYEHMPDSHGNPLSDGHGIGNKNNVFDAHLSGISRAHINGKYNDLQNNNNAIDVDVFDLSKVLTKYRNSNSKIDSVYLQTASNYDGVAMNMLTFVTELYTPNVCYDYALMDGNYTVIEDVNKSFIKEANGKPLKVKVTIRSKEADFDLVNSKMQIVFTPNTIFSYIPGSAQYTVPNTNAYVDAVEVDDNKGIIAVGSNPTDSGGTIASNETIYTIQSYNLDSDFSGSFDVKLNSEINFNTTTKVKYSINLKRCPTNPTYDPIYWKFNIEKPNVTFNTPEDQRYSLPTQITGRPYQVTIASYKQDPGGSYTVPNSVDATVELELINAGGFDNNSSAGFDTVCEEPSSIGEGVFVKLNNQDRKVINIPGDYPTYPSNLALRNATFRMWVLTKKVNSVTEFINNQCQSAYDNKCFTGVYASMYKDYDKMHLCSNSCNPASALSNSDSRQCYDCLKKYFGKPVCARDNFAIRPESFSIALSDDNQTTSANKSFIKSNFAKNATGIVNLAAGYLYRLDINATKYNSSAHENAVGYQFNSEFTYNKALLKFDDSASCNSKSDKNLNITLSDGKSNDHTDEKNAISAKNGLIAENTGKYKLNLHDNGWTAVDQKDYIYKPFPNVEDCIANSSAAMASGLPGCNIDSTTNAYKDLTVKSYPYKFEVNASVSNNLSAGKDYIYANDFTQIGVPTNIPTNIPNTMAIKIDKVVVAKDFNGNSLSNYTSECSAEDLKLSYDFNTSEPQVTNINGDNLTLNYYSYDNYGVASSQIKDSLENDKDNITYSKESFAQSQNGSSNINTYINVKRTFNTPMNPFKINFNSLSLLLNKNIYVDLKNDYKASGDQDLNSSMIVYYGKAVASLPLYDDVVEDSINTPIKYEVFCNYTLEKCKDYGIDVGSANTDEYNWWINTKHDNNDPKADLISINNREVSIETNSSNVSLGIDNGVVVDGANIQTKPFVSTIGFDINTNRPWVVYNKNNNSILTDLYKVRFVGKQDAWSGSGKSGFTIDAYKGTSRKTNKIDW